MFLEGKVLLINHIKSKCSSKSYSPYIHDLFAVINIIKHDRAQNYRQFSQQQQHIVITITKAIIIILFIINSKLPTKTLYLQCHKHPPVCPSKPSSVGLQRICSWHPSMRHSLERGSSQRNHHIVCRRSAISRDSTVEDQHYHGIVKIANPSFHLFLIFITIFPWLIQSQTNHHPRCAIFSATGDTTVEDQHYPALWRRPIPPSTSSSSSSPFPSSWPISSLTNHHPNCPTFSAENLHYCWNQHGHSVMKTANPLFHLFLIIIITIFITMTNT